MYAMTPAPIKHIFKFGEAYEVVWLDASSSDVYTEPPYGTPCHALGWYLDTDENGTHLFASEGPEDIAEDVLLEDAGYRFFVHIPNAMITSVESLELNRTQMPAEVPTQTRTYWVIQHRDTLYMSQPLGDTPLQMTTVISHRHALQFATEETANAIRSIIFGWKGDRSSVVEIVEALGQDTIDAG